MLLQPFLPREVLFFRVDHRIAPSPFLLPSAPAQEGAAEDGGVEEAHLLEVEAQRKEHARSPAHVAKQAGQGG
eukprot:9159104-Prorocentrum_lima.AAC.1